MNHYSQKPNNQSGFTIIEMTVVIFGFTLIIWGLVGLYSNIFTFSNQQSGLLSDAEAARNVTFNIVGQLRNAQTGQNGAYPLDTAGTSTIIFYGTTGNSSNVQRIRYYEQSGKLYEGLTNYNNGSYNTSTELSTMVLQDLANNSSTPLFYYYTGAYIGSSTQASLSQPVSVTAVTFVNVQLPIYNKAGVKNSNTYTVTASAAIRNLKTNLGN